LTLDGHATGRRAGGGDRGSGEVLSLVLDGLPSGSAFPIFFREALGDVALLVVRPVRRARHKLKKPRGEEG
jgi:hypothetical protein